MNIQILKNELKNLITTIQGQIEAINENIQQYQIDIILENVKKFHDSLLMLSKKDVQSPLITPDLEHRKDKTDNLQIINEEKKKFDSGSQTENREIVLTNEQYNKLKNEIIQEILEELKQNNIIKTSQEPHLLKEKRTESFTIDNGVTEEEKRNKLKKSHQIEKFLTIADKLKTSQTTLHEELSKVKELTLADKIQRQKIEDLKEIIDVNTRYRLIEELFEGSDSKYKMAIEKINSFSTKEEVFEFIHKNYKWDFQNDLVKDFMKIIERKFM